MMAKKPRSRPVRARKPPELKFEMLTIKRLATRKDLRRVEERQARELEEERRREAAA